MRRILTDPLCHFFLIAAVLVLSYRLLGPEEDSRPQLRVEADDVALAVADWAGQHGRQPDADEIATILDRLEDEALLLAEARAHDLDRHDPMVRDRLLDLAVLALAGDAPEPDEATLRSWFERHPERWQLEERLVLEQVPLGEADPEAVRQRLEDGLDPYAFATGTGLPVTLGPLTRRQLVEWVGADFTAAAWDLPEQQWAGPITSDSDRHLLRVVQRLPAITSDFESLRFAVAQDWQSEDFAQRRAQVLSELRSRYRVELPEPGR